MTFDLTSALSPSKAATLLGVSDMTVLRLIERQEIEAVRVGSQWRIPAAAIPAYIERNRVQPKVQG